MRAFRKFDPRAELAPPAPAEPEQAASSETKPASKFSGFSNFSSPKGAPALPVESPAELDEEGEAEERIGLITERAGVPAEWAMGFARLCERPCPAGIRESRWLRLISDVDQFLAQWADKAAKLGWQTLDLFGVHPTCPEARFDCMGLLWILNGDTIPALSEDRAELRNHRGARQSFYRRAHASEAIPAWELSND